MNELDKLMQSPGKRTFREQLEYDRNKNIQQWKTIGQFCKILAPIFFYLNLSFLGYSIILISSHKVHPFLVGLGLVLPGLIIYGVNRYLVQKTGKHYLKGWKKRSIFGLSSVLSVLVAIPYAAFYPEMNDSNPRLPNTEIEKPVAATTDSSQIISAVNQELETQQASTDNTLGIDWPTFYIHFNEYLAKSETGFQMGDVTFQNDMFSYSFSERIVMNGRIVNQKLNNVLLVGQGDGTSSSAADILLVIASLVRAVNPQMPEEKVTALLHKIIETKPKKEFPEILYSNTTLGGKEYYLSMSPAIGVMFSIEKVQK